VVADPAASPPLSVVIATAEPWPEIRECLESVLHQARSVGADVVAADGCGRALPGFLLARAVLTIIQERRQRVRLALGLPLLAMLVSCHAVGEGVGYLSGPGSSPLRVR
jgi:hypothetical protein